MALELDDALLADQPPIERIEQPGYHQLDQLGRPNDVDDGSHLYAAMFAASALFLMACLVSLRVLKSFPNLGKGGPTQNAR